MASLLVSDHLKKMNRDTLEKAAKDIQTSATMSQSTPTPQYSVEIPTSRITPSFQLALWLWTHQNIKKCFTVTIINRKNVINLEKQFMEYILYSWYIKDAQETYPVLCIKCIPWLLYKRQRRLSLIHFIPKNLFQSLLIFVKLRTHSGKTLYGIRFHPLIYYRCSKATAQKTYPILCIICIPWFRVKGSDGCPLCY